MFQIITDAQEILECKQQWNQVANDFPFSSWEWLNSWLQNLGSLTQPLVMVQTDQDGKWTGIAPFCVVDSSAFSRKICFIGSGDTCTDYASLICSEENRESFSTEVAQWLLEQSQSNDELLNFDFVDLEGVSPADPAIRLLTEKLAQGNFAVNELPLESCWVAELPETWEEFNAQLSKSMRRKTKEAGKRLDAPTTRILSSDESSFAEVWAIFIDLHQQRRNMLGQSGCFADHRFESFLRDAVQGLIESQQAEIIVIESHGKPLASSLCLFDDTTVMMYQTGFDVERRNESPGYQNVLHAMRGAIQRGYKYFDFLRGDEPYKARWKTKKRPLMTLRFVPPRFGAKVRQNIWATGKAIKGFANQLGLFAK